MDRSNPNSPAGRDLPVALFAHTRPGPERDRMPPYRSPNPRVWDHSDSPQANPISANILSNQNIRVRHPLILLLFVNCPGFRGYPDIYHFNGL